MGYNLALLIMTNSIKKTPEGQSYWNDNGAYQEEYDRLYEELVPRQGEAPTIHGELIRGASQLAYDYYNNGNGNAIEFLTDTCPDCGGTGWEESPYDEDEMRDCSYCGGECEVPDGVELRGYYMDIARWMKRYMHHEAPLNNLLWGVKKLSHFDDDQLDERLYVDLLDAVMHQVLTTDNAVNPQYKPEEV